MRSPKSKGAPRRWRRSSTTLRASLRRRAVASSRDGARGRLLVGSALHLCRALGARNLSASALAREAQRVETEAIRALERSDAAVSARINERTEAQIQLSERLRRYVSWMLVGSVGGLAVLFAAYRRVQLRERAAQQRIERLAHFDMLTGLPNRALDGPAVAECRAPSAGRVPSQS